jgi:hypothetical protein
MCISPGEPMPEYKCVGWATCCPPIFTAPKWWASKLARPTDDVHQPRNNISTFCRWVLINRGFFILQVKVKKSLNSTQLGNRQVGF